MKSQTFFSLFLMIQAFILVAPRRDSSSDETFFEKIKSLNYGAPLLAKFSNGSLTIVKNYNTMTSQKNSNLTSLLL